MTAPSRGLTPAPVTALVGANLRRQLRDRIGLLFIVIMPFVAIIFVGFTLGGNTDAKLPVGIVTTDGDPIGQRVSMELARDGEIAVEQLPDAEAISTGVREGSLAAGLVIDPGTTEIPIFYSSTSGTGAAARASVDGAVGRIAAEIEATRAAEAAGATPQQAAELLEAAAAESEPVRIDRDGGDNSPRGFAYTAPANLVLFTFINSLAVAAALVESRKLGMIRRTTAGPVSRRAVLLGEALSRFLIAAVQSALIVVVSAVAFRVNWGSPPAVAAVVGMFALFSTGAAMLLGSLANSPTQPAAIGPTLGIVLGMLGGCLWPREVAPDALNAIGLAFPHAWAMDALIQLSDGRSGFGEVLPQLAVLTAMTVLIGAAALVAFNRRALKVS